MTFSLFSAAGAEFFMRWMHYFFGVLWIGLLYYFNFVQTPFMAEAEAAAKSGVVQKLVPRALLWFRWAAMGTFLVGWAMIGDKVGRQGMALDSSWGVLILSGGLLGTLMWFNVWFVIWPNQKVVIENAVRTAKGEAANPAAAASAARAGVASRTNVLFSLPMLFFMGAASHLPISITGSVLPYWGAFAVIAGLIELNALKGKMGPMGTVKGVLHLSLALALVLYVLLEVLTK